MDYLDTLENRTIYVLREAYRRYRNDIALLWSAGKDSTALLWIARKAFFGKIPFPAVHIDTTFKFGKVYEFRDAYARRLNLNLIISKNEKALEDGMNPEHGKFICCNTLKTEAIKATVKERGLKALLLAIRRDEHGIRAKERYFSPRASDFTWNYAEQPAEPWDLYHVDSGDGLHTRIHPMLHWAEQDVWEYTLKERIPVVDLYLASGGKRYRSIGCARCCSPVASNADTIPKIIRELESTRVSERGGRAQDKEDAYMMQRLRSLGYM